MLFFYDGWLSVIRIILILIFVYGALALTVKSTTKNWSELNAGQSIAALSMGVLLGFTLLNLSIPLINFVLALYLLVAIFHLMGR